MEARIGSADTVGAVVARGGSGGRCGGVVVWCRRGFRWWDGQLCAVWVGHSGDGERGCRLGRGGDQWHTCTGQVVIGAGVTVTLQSGVHPGILDGGATGSAVSIGSGSNLTVQNLTIRNGSSGFLGGGVDMVCCSSTLNLSNAVVSGNTAVAAGGGVYVNGGTVNAVSSQVSGNSSSFGAGIEAEVGSTVNLTNSTVSGNSNGVGGAGGGIALDSSTGTLIGSTVSNNQAASMRAAACWSRTLPCCR